MTEGMACPGDILQAASKLFQERREAAAEKLGQSLHRLLFPSPARAAGVIPHPPGDAAQGVQISGMLMWICSWPEALLHFSMPGWS